MLAALGFVVRVLFIRYLANDFANVSRDYLWMTPLGYLALFGAVAVPVLLVTWRLAASRVAWCAAWVFTTLAVFDAFMPITSIGRFAAFVLAAGAGVVVARRAAQHSALVSQVAMVIAGVIAAGLAVGAILRPGLPAATADVPAVRAPNVLLLILDTVRADELGTYGYARGTTPNIDAFAQKSTIFESAMAAAPWTLPSHGSMFTGRYAANLSTDYRVPLDRADSTLAEAFARRGYATVAYVGNVAYASWESGLGRGFQAYNDFQRTFEQTVKSTHLGRTDLSNDLFRSTTWRQAAGAVRRMGLQEVPRPQLAPNSAEYLTNAFLDWHASRDTLRPFFAFVNFYDAHDPYEPVEPYRTRFSGPKAKDAKLRDLYDAELAYIDAHIGRLFGELERRGAFSNTLVILAADHGEQFGERNTFGHFNSIYMPLLWVPLMFRFDGHVPPGRRVTGEFSLRDLAATIFDISGASSSPFPGTSLAGLWGTDSAVISSPVVASYSITKKDSPRTLDNGMLSLVEGGWHYILTGRKAYEELFRYRADPVEATNLVGSDSVVADTGVRCASESTAPWSGSSAKRPRR